MKKPVILAVAILLIDQIVKVGVKLSFSLGEEVNLIGDWCRLYFIENEGMAFGMKFGGEMGKYFLTIMRVVVSSFLGVYIYRLIKRGAGKLMVYSLTLIFAGAVGNIIDSLFYGLIFSESTYFSVAEFLPAGGGYASLCTGKVVDMFYLPIIDTTLPDWLPFFGGRPFRFFNAIFNVSDVAITVGVFVLIYALAFKSKQGEAKSGTPFSDTETVNDKTE